MTTAAVALPPKRLEALCRKWKVRELALFGSVLRPDFRPDSDVDVLVTFDDDAPWSLWDLLDMREDLRELERTPDFVFESVRELHVALRESDGAGPPR